jgi:hypothetical protein
VADETVDRELQDVVIKRSSSERVEDIEGVGGVGDHTQLSGETGGRDKIYRPSDGERFEEKDVVRGGIQGGRR